jgi:hypothetical protein
MKPEFRNPLEAIAIPELKRQFGDLLSIRAQVGDFEYGLVASILGNVLLFGQLQSAERQRWERTVRAAHYYLDRGALKRQRESCESYVRIADAMPSALNDVMKKRDAADKLLGDEWIEALLALYKSITEGLLTLIAAPVIVGFRHIYGVNGSAFNPKPDGRVDLKAIELMEDWSAAPSNLLKEGLNKHVRNAYAHQRYRILDGDIVELWDETPHGKLTWGPERWKFADVETLCDRLLTTCVAVTLALAIFGINYRKLIMDRGWMPANIAAPKLRFEDLKRLIESYAEYNSFTVISVEAQDKELALKLQTQHRGLDQTEKLVLGGPGGSRAYEMPVIYRQELVAEIVLGLLQRTVPSSEAFERYRVEVIDENDAAVGELVITSTALSKVQGPKGGSVAKDRAWATADSLGDSRMWVKIEEPSRPVTTPRRRAL